MRINYYFKPLQKIQIVLSALIMVFLLSSCEKTSNSSSGKLVDVETIRIEDGILSFNSVIDYREYKEQLQGLSIEKRLELENQIGYVSKQTQYEVLCEDLFAAKTEKEFLTLIYNNQHLVKLEDSTVVTIGNDDYRFLTGVNTAIRIGDFLYDFNLKTNQRIVCKIPGISYKEYLALLNTGDNKSFIKSDLVSKEGMESKSSTTYTCGSTYCMSEYYKTASKKADERKCKTKVYSEVEVYLEDNVNYLPFVKFTVIQGVHVHIYGLKRTWLGYWVTYATRLQLTNIGYNMDAYDGNGQVSGFDGSLWAPQVDLYYFDVYKTAWTNTGLYLDAPDDTPVDFNSVEVESTSRGVSYIWTSLDCTF